jgi:hypothetical protein
MRTRRHPHLYELSAWPWLERLSRREGRVVTLADVPPADWNALASQGFDFVFLMGVWQRSAVGRDIARRDPDLRHEYDRALPAWSESDVPGSPYCIDAYVPEARMGGWAGLECARRELRARGVGLVLDYVPNHTGFDHPWVSAHPERYVLGTADDGRMRPGEFRRAGAHLVACGRDPFFPPWRDVAQLNYFNPETRAAMRGTLREIARHCDGVRCDMAMLVLTDVFERTWRHVLRDRWPRPSSEFWPEATREVPSLIYLAEVYWDLEWTLQQQGFHFTYDKRLLDRLRAAQGEDVRLHLTADAPFRDRLVRFLENHDEARSAAVFGTRLPAAATLAATLPGLRFFFDGQLTGARLRVPVQLGRWPDEPADPSIADLYRVLLTATGQPIFHDGEWQLLDVSRVGDVPFPGLIAYRWRLGRELAIVVVNVGDSPAEGHVAVAADLPDGDEFDFHDRVGGETYRWGRQSLVSHGLYVRLLPGQAHVFVVGGQVP